MRHVLGRARRARRGIAVLAVLVACVACSSSGGSTQTADPTRADLNDNSGTSKFQGAGVDPAQPRPAFSLTDTAGKSFSFGSVTAQHPTLLYFGYTQCPDVCPASMADIAVALRHLPAALAKSTYVVFVTTDVKTDTGPVIQKWLSNFAAGSKAHWVGLRGTQAQIDTAQAAAHITVAEDDGKTHSAQILLYGPDDYAHVTFLQSNNEQKQIEHDLPLIAKGES